MKEFEEIVKEKGLPSVGQTVRNKTYDTLWRVMEKKEVWHNMLQNPETGAVQMVPAIYLIFWKVQEGERPGVGPMMGFEYTLYDNSFALNWDIVKD